MSDYTTYDEIHNEVVSYLTVSLAKWRKHLPEMYNDAFQEGLIQAWRDVQAGVTPKLKVLRRAKMSAEKYLHRNGEYSFGKPKKSRDGLRTNQATVEKVKAYLEETKGLREGVWPTPKTVSDALGINHSSAQKILKDIREGRVDHMVYRPDGRMDWNHYSTMSLELMTYSEAGVESSNRHWSDNPKLELRESFEDLFVEDQHFKEVLSQLTEQHRTVLYMYFAEGYSPTDIGRHYGNTDHPSAHGNMMIQRAVNQAHIVVDPYHGTCTKNHERTPENTVVARREGGYWYRSCSTCKSAAAQGVNERKKTGHARKGGRKPTTHCPKGHLKEKVGLDGALRCKVCRRENQRRYVERQKNK